MDCGCMLMLGSFGLGLLLIRMGAFGLINPRSHTDQKIGITLLVIGIALALALAPFVWLSPYLLHLRYRSGKYD